MHDYFPMTKHRLYTTWFQMKQRCLDELNPAYKDYGGRGIKLAPEWHWFPNFADDMLPSFVEGLTLERIDNDKGYSKENCRWASRREQANNRRSNTLLRFNDETRTLLEWSREVGLKPSTITMRLYQYGWSVDKTLSTSVRRT